MPSRAAVDFFGAHFTDQPRPGGLGALRVLAEAFDTDGIDGSEDNAGAVLAPDSIRKGGDAKDRPAKNNSYGFFSALGDLLVTGPTRTNVNDYRAIVVA